MVKKGVHSVLRQEYSILNGMMKKSIELKVKKQHQPYETVLCVTATI